MAMQRYVGYLFAGFVLLGGSACEKEAALETDGLSYVNGVPYYHFTDSDRLWLQHKPGDEWSFKNSAGIQRVYRLSIRQQLQSPYKTSAPSGILSTKYTLVSYHDELELSVFNTNAADSASGGRFYFYRDATVTGHNQAGSGPSRFYTDGEWFSFLGTGKSQSDDYQPNDAQLAGAFTQLLVQGKAYSEVVLFSAQPRSSFYPAPTSASVNRIFYDRQAGIVRLVTVGGEVWDRTP